MVQYLHFRILEFPLILRYGTMSFLWTGCFRQVLPAFQRSTSVGFAAWDGHRWNRNATWCWNHPGSRPTLGLLRTERAYDTYVRLCQMSLSIPAMPFILYWPTYKTHAQTNTTISCSDTYTRSRSYLTCSCLASDDSCPRALARRRK